MNLMCNLECHRIRLICQVHAASAFPQSLVLVVSEWFSNCPSHVLKWFFVADWRLQIEDMFSLGFALLFRAACLELEAFRCFAFRLVRLTNSARVVRACAYGFRIFCLKYLKRRLIFSQNVCCAISREVFEFLLQVLRTKSSGKWCNLCCLQFWQHSSFQVSKRSRENKNQGSDRCIQF